MHEQLRDDLYQPLAVRRTWIPKPGSNEKRPLGIPNVIDRWVQQAVLQVLEPIFEPTFHDSSHGFRRRRGAQTAIAEATTHLAEGYGITVDIDLSKFFDRVHHQRLLSRLAQQVQDGRIRELTPRNWGQSLAACLANVNRYLRGWFGYFQLCTDKVLYHFQKFDAHIRRRLRAMILRQKKRPPTVFSPSALPRGTPSYVTEVRQLATWPLVSQQSTGSSTGIPQ